jgi:hypothetical protein
LRRLTRRADGLDNRDSGANAGLDVEIRIIEHVSVGGRL